MSEFEYRYKKKHNADYEINVYREINAAVFVETESVSC